MTLCYRWTRTVRSETENKEGKTYGHNKKTKHNNQIFLTIPERTCKYSTFLPAFVYLSIVC